MMNDKKRQLLKDARSAASALSRFLDKGHPDTSQILTFSIASGDRLRGSCYDALAGLVLLADALAEEIYPCNLND
jgi:hypothetical protein